MKRLICVFALFALLLPVCVSADEEAEIYPVTYAFEEYWYTDAAAFGDTLPVRAALLMEASTGRVLYAQNENEHYPIASVTKIMPTLLVMEAIDGGKLSLDETVTVGSDAANMGGSQVYLEVGEKMTVRDLLKAMIVVSANDATVAFAEHLAGSEASFVEMMNERASRLGMTNTHFANCHGLNEDSHYSSAFDVALMTRELLTHEKIFDYTTIWMDTIRNGSFGLANTNKLIRFYDGANGMKTGFTDRAKYCLSATAKRDGMQLIAVIIGAETSDARFASAKKLLDYGFANYCVFTPEKPELGKLKVKNGKRGSVDIDCEVPTIMIEKGKKGNLTVSVTLDELYAPVEAGSPVGLVTYYIDGECAATANVYAVSGDEKVKYSTVLGRLLKAIISFI